MINKENSIITNQNSSKKVMVGILVFGSIWGLFDAISVLYIAPFFHVRQLCLCPLTVVIFGFFLMTIALVMYKKPIMMVGIGVTAALFKLLNFAILPLPVINGYVAFQPVVNPALATLVASIIYALFAGLLMNKLKSNIHIRIIAGILTGFLCTVAFVYTAFYITTTPPLIVNTPTQFIFPFHSLASAILGAVFLPFGYWVGANLQQKTFFLSVKKPLLYYLGSGMTVVFCLIISTIILMSGI